MTETTATDIQLPAADDAASMLRSKHKVLAEHEVELAREVFTLIGEPLDVWAVAATLESIGLRDLDAVTLYQRPNLFTLAERILYLIHVDPTRTRSREELPPVRTRETHMAQALKFYLRGASTALPMAGQIASVLLLRYSLWA